MLCTYLYKVLLFLFSSHYNYIIYILLIIVLLGTTVWISVLFSLWLQSTFITTLPITFYIIGPNYNLEPTHSSPSISLSLVYQIAVFSCCAADCGNINSGAGDWVLGWYEIFSIFRDEARLSFITISICIYFRKCVALSPGYLLTKCIVLSTIKHISIEKIILREKIF